MIVQLIIITILLNGNNLSKCSVLPIVVSKRAAHFLNNLHETNEIDKNSLSKFCINRLLIYAQLRVNTVDIDFAKEASRVLINKEYLSDKNKWLSNFIKLNKIGIKHFELENCVDYLNYIGNDYVLKNISRVKLLNDITHWHNLLSAKNTYLMEQNFLIPSYGVEEFEYNFKDEVYCIKQIKSTRELFEEGATMKHCVFSYIKNCLKSKLAIYSLKKKTKNGDNISLLTIELVSRSIVQARGKRNRFYTDEEMQIIKIWASQENLKIAV